MISAVVLSTGVAVSVTAQSSTRLTRVPAESISAPNAKQREQRNSAHTRVSISVRDSTIASTLHQIARQAGLRLAYNGNDPTFAKRVTVSVTNVPVIDALTRVLEGTGLIARLAPDGETVVVGAKPVKSSTSSAVDSMGIVSGRVVDSATGKTLPGVLVTVQGTKRSVLTDPEGRYTLASIPSGAQTVIFKLIGYRTLLRPVSVTPEKPVSVSVSLPAVATALSEVVTTVTGAQRRVEVPSDIVRIDAEKIMQRAPVQSVTDLLEAAQVPGVVVTRGSGEPGAPSRIRIRGLRSMTSSNDPVVIVDGNWIDASVGKPSGFDDIDPATIETVEIVRGPSASTLYGADAANGVIVITTKRGRAGPTRWRLQYQRNWSQPYGKSPLAYAGFGYDISGRRMWCPIASIVINGCIQDSVAVYDPNVSLLQTEGTAAWNRVIVGADGGSASATWAITGTGTSITGVSQLKPVDAIRYRMLNIPIEQKFQRPLSEIDRTITSTLTLNPKPSLTLGMTVTGSQRDLPSNLVSADFGGLNAGGIDAAYSLDTTQFWRQSDGRKLTSGIWKNESASQRSNYLLGGRMDWRGATGWFVNANAGISNTLFEENTFTRKIRCEGVTCADTLGTRAQNITRSTDLTGRFTLSKRLNLGRLSRVLDVQPSFGGDYRKTERSAMGIRVDSIPAGERSLVVGGRPTVSSSRVTSAVAGYYANLRIGILQRLYVDLGGRQDLGSALKSLLNGSRLPKLGGSYMLSDEPFWPKQSVINTLRLRSAVGYSVIQPTLEDIHGQYGSSSAYVGGQWVTALDLLRTGNVALKPERVMEVEFGVDTDLLDNRVNLVATYAQSENINATVDRTLPPSAGKGGTMMRKENLGHVRNRSVELSGEYKLIDAPQTRLSVFHTLTLRDNVVTKLGNKVTPWSNSAVGQIRQGYPIAGVWVNQVVSWRDANHDGLLVQDEIVLGDSLVYAGWSQPKYEAGYGVTFTLFGRLTFDTRLSQRSQYVVEYTRNNKYGTEDASAPLAVQASEVAGRVNNRTAISDWRWNSASVTYFLPPHALQKMKLRTLSVSLKASNLGVWSNYTGRDPGVNSSILTKETLSDNGNTVPQPRLFVVDFNLGL